MGTSAKLFIASIGFFMLFTGSVIYSQTAFPKTRDPLKWPFAANSIWNMPIHKNAVYIPANITPSPNKGMSVEDVIIVAQPKAPLKQIRQNTAGWGYRVPGARCKTVNSTTLYGGMKVPVPDNFTTEPNYSGAAPNHSSAIVGADGRTVYQSEPMHVCSPGGIVTSQYVYPTVDLFTDGTLGAHGGSSLGSMGGTIRIGEWVPGGVIRHALTILIHADKFSYYSYSEPDGKPGYRWPAIKCDSYADPVEYGGKIPAVQTGTLLALKPEYDISKLRTGPAKVLAQCLKDYGAYISDDSGWEIYAVSTEWGPDGRVQDEFNAAWGFPLESTELSSCTGTGLPCLWSRDMAEIMGNLCAVDNNTPATIGGGPNDDWANRRAPMAPPFGATATVSGGSPSLTSSVKALYRKNSGFMVDLPVASDYVIEVMCLSGATVGRAAGTGKNALVPISSGRPAPGLYLVKVSTAGKGLSTVVRCTIGSSF